MIKGSKFSNSYVQQKMLLNEQHVKLESIQLLKSTPVVPSFPFDLLAVQTEGLSGSDLQELCRNAAMVPVREYMRHADGDRDVLEKGRVEVCL